MGVNNPKFLNVEKKVVYNIRLPQRLIDKLNGYAELTGNTTTNIVTNVLSDFVADKVVLNDYLDNIGGVTVKIPFVIHQKNRFTIDNNSGTFILADYNLLNYNNSSIYQYTINDDAGVLCDEIQSERLDAELFEVKKIPNNLDINVNGSYTANKKILIFNHNAIHSGIELFVYNIAEIFFNDAVLIDNFDSFDNALYCLYFEVSPDNSVTIHLIDYLTAINLLSASGNEYYKNLIIACATELKELNEIGYDYFDELENRKNDLTFDSETDYVENYDYEVERIEKELQDIYLSILKSALSDVADKYNSNNIIPFGSDIFSRLAVKEIELQPDYFNELIDEKINEKFERLEKENAELKSRLDKLDRLKVRLQ